MSLIDDDGTNGFSFVWAIENFSYCLRKPGKCFDSPSFTLDTNGTSKFRLRLAPRGLQAIDSSKTQNKIAFGLFLEDASTSENRVYFVSSIRTNKGTFKKLRDSIRDLSIKKAGGEYLLKREELLGKDDEGYLDNDTITLRCRIWKIDDEILPPGQCYIRTIIDVERITNIWSLEKFRQNMSADEIVEKQPISFERPYIVDMKFILYRRVLFLGDRIKLEIKQNDENQPCFLTCDLSLLDIGGNIVHSIRDEHWFEEASGDLQVWTLPHIPLSKILNCEKPYLRCELVVSSGSEYSWVERVEIGKVEDDLPRRLNLKKELDHGDSWKDDLQRFYSDGTFTDMTVRTASKDFPAHKAILCARSTVFRAMFERDMQENRTNVMHIEDVDADTVHKMLLFVYSDVVEDLDCDVASKLYFAADKYRITALRRKCSDFFQEHTSVSNVCEITVLASKHQDEDLKSFAEDFIVEHAAEVMRSVEWKKFLQDHVSIASEMMHMLLLRYSSI